MPLQFDDESCFQKDSTKNGTISNWESRLRGTEEGRMSHLIFADKCFLFAENKQMLKMVGDTAEDPKKRSLEWKEREMEMIGP